MVLLLNLLNATIPLGLLNLQLVVGRVESLDLRLKLGLLVSVRFQELSVLLELIFLVFYLLAFFIEQVLQIVELRLALVQVNDELFIALFEKPYLLPQVALHLDFLHLVNFAFSFNSRRLSAEEESALDHVIEEVFLQLKFRYALLELLDSLPLL